MEPLNIFLLAAGILAALVQLWYMAWALRVSRPGTRVRITILWGLVAVVLIPLAFIL